MHSLLTVSGQVVIILEKNPKPRLRYVLCHSCLMRSPWLHPDRIFGYPANTRVSARLMHRRARLMHRRAKKHNYHHCHRMFQNQSGKSRNNRHGCNRNRLPCQHAAYLAFTQTSSQVQDYYQHINFFFKHKAHF